MNSVKDFIKKLDQETTCKHLALSPEFREVLEMYRLKNCKHLTDKANPDGYDEKLKRFVEVKTCRPTEKSKICGAIVYSDSKKYAYQKKINRGGEIIVYTGFDDFGNVLFRFFLEWDDIKHIYKKYLKEEGVVSSITISCCHWKKAKSVVVDYVADDEILKEKYFTGIFYRYLIKKRSECTNTEISDLSEHFKGKK